MTLSINCKDAGDPVCTHTMYGETEEELFENACWEIDGTCLRKPPRYNVILFKTAIYYNLFEVEENHREWI